MSCLSTHAAGGSQLAPRNAESPMLTPVFAVAGGKSRASLLTPFRSEGLQKRGRQKPIEEWARERCVRSLSEPQRVSRAVSAVEPYKSAEIKERVSLRGAPAGRRSVEGGETGPRVVEVGGMTAANHPLANVASAPRAEAHWPGIYQPGVPLSG
jgi:hypothetical protein